MAEQTTQIQLKRGTASALAAVNPVLAAGEPCLETDTGKIKHGNGVTAWNALPYANPAVEVVDGGTLTSTLPPPGPGFTPRSISGLQLWLDASDDDTINLVNNRVAQWRDKSTNARQLVQALKSNRPINANTVKNKRVVTFDGVDNVLRGQLPLTEFTVFAVFNPSSASTDSKVISTNATDLLTTQTGDPHFDNVALLLHMDGTNGSTTFTDSSSDPKDVFAETNNTISTTKAKFGQSAYFNGTGYRIYTESTTALDISGGPYTIEFWLYVENLLPGDAARLFTFEGPNNVRSGMPIYSPTGQAPYWIGMNKYGVSVGGQTPRVVSNNKWTHIALSYNGTAGTIYVDGVDAGFVPLQPDWSEQIFTPGAYSVSIGANTAPFSFYGLVGYIDDFRITKGVARYTANFIPPKSPFADVPFKIGAGSLTEYPAALNTPVQYSLEYDDGELVTKLNGRDAQTVTTTLPASAEFSLGAALDDYADAFGGDIAELVVYDRLLTPQEYQQVKAYLHIKWVDEPGFLNKLLGFWPMNEADGRRFDTSDYAHDLLVGEAASYSSDVLSGPGKILNGALFSGLSYLEADIAQAMESVSFWVKLTPHATSERTIYEIIGQWAGAVGSWRFIHDVDNGGLVVDVATTRILTNADLDDGDWHHVVGTFNRTTKLYKVYVDNVQISSTLIPITNMLGNYNLRLASTSLTPSTDFFGTIDSIGGWDRLLTTIEIAQLYNSGNGIEQLT